MPFQFELVTPERLVRSESVHMVVVPGTEGDFGVLQDHAPVMTSIRDDAELAIYATEGANPETLKVTGGFAEVNDKGLSVLADSVG